MKEKFTPTDPRKLEEIIEKEKKLLEVSREYHDRKAKQQKTVDFFTQAKDAFFTALALAILTIVLFLVLGFIASW